jgi:feruloyl esterase
MDRLREYDGFLIGAPAYYWQQFRLADGWPNIVFKKLVQQGGALPTVGQMAAANAAAIAACDVEGRDTVIDGIVADPRACTFSAKSNICGTAGAPMAPSCLASDQAAAIDRIWDGPFGIPCLGGQSSVGNHLRRRSHTRVEHDRGFHGQPGSGS